MISTVVEIYEKSVPSLI